MTRKKATIFQTAYGSRERPVIKCPKGRTQQAFKNECNINAIMAKAQRDGVVTHLNRFNGQYGDFTDLPQDYHESLLQVQAAQEAFASLPSGVRNRFDNDPGKFLAFVEDPANRKEMLRMGLMREAPEPEPASAPAEQNVEPKGETPTQATAAE